MMRVVCKPLPQYGNVLLCLPSVPIDPASKRVAEVSMRLPCMRISFILLGNESWKTTPTNIMSISLSSAIRGIAMLFTFPRAQMVDLQLMWRQLMMSDACIDDEYTDE
jgi:hypothetical protein